eukprot:13360460-Heterocapsa_arctica.AAC.1
MAEDVCLSWGSPSHADTKVIGAKPPEAPLSVGEVVGASGVHNNAASFHAKKVGFRGVDPN